MVPGKVVSGDARWFRPRGYTHFDVRLSEPTVTSLVQDPEKVRKHSFWPFLKFSKTTPRYRRPERRTVSKVRDLYYAAHVDAHVYAWYAYVLAERLEAILAADPCGPSVLAYRAIGKSNIDFAAEAFDSIASHAPCVARAYDITSFFDTIDHTILKKAWCDLLGVRLLPEDHYQVFKSVTKYAYVNLDDLEGLRSAASAGASTRLCSARDFRELVRGAGLVHVNETRRGIPQGTPISAVLSNIYLLGFDRQMTALQGREVLSYRRYSDDILCICDKSAIDACEARVRQELTTLKLEINAAKTETSTFECEAPGDVQSDRPLTYLGFTFDGKSASLRSQTLSRYYRRMKTAVRRAKSAAGRNPKDHRIYRARLYERFSHLGNRNFVTYAKRGARAMDSSAVRRQASRFWRKLQAEIAKHLPDTV